MTCAPYNAEMPILAHAQPRGPELLRRARVAQMEYRGPQ
jgi:hypothetical protein